MSGQRAPGLVIGASKDPLEAEADRVAQQVLLGPAQPAVTAAPPRIQRATNQSAGVAAAGTAPRSVDGVLSSTGHALDPPLRHDMEQRFGHDFSRVRVHCDTAADHSARDVGAKAYTVGSDIVFGAGRFAPATRQGRGLLAHELTHVVQQASRGEPRQLFRQELEEAEVVVPGSITAAIKELASRSMIMTPPYVMTDLLAIIDEFEYSLRNPAHLEEVAGAVARYMPEDVVLLFLRHIEIVQSPPKPGSGEAYLAAMDRAGRNVLGHKAPGVMIGPTIDAFAQMGERMANRASAFCGGLVEGATDGVSTQPAQAGGPRALDEEFLGKLRRKLLESELLTVLFPTPFALGAAAGIAGEWRDLWQLVTNLSETKDAVVEVAEKIFAPGGEELARAMGHDAGLGFVNEIRTEVDKSVVEFSYWLGKKIGPALVDLALSIAGISIGAIVLKRSLTVVKTSLGTLSDFAKYVKRAERIVPDLPSAKAITPKPPLPAAAKALPPTPGSPNAKALSHTPDAPAAKALSDTPDVPAAKALSDMPDVPAAKALSDTPDVPAAKALSDTPDVPVAKALPDTPDVPVAKALADTPDMSAANAPPVATADLPPAHAAPPHEAPQVPAAPAPKPDLAKLAPDEVVAYVKGKPLTEVKADLEAAGYSVSETASGTKVIGVRSDAAKAKGLKKLHVDETGMVREGTKGRTSNRISSPGLLRRRVVKAIQDANPGFVLDHQAHHLIPDEVARKGELLKVAAERELFDIDGVANGVLLPENSTAAKAYKHPIHGDVDNLPVHRTSHAKFSENATKEAEDLWNDLTQNGTIDPATIPDVKIQEAVETLQRRLIDFIQSSGSRIPSGPRAGELAESERRETGHVVA